MTFVKKKKTGPHTEETERGVGHETAGNVRETGGPHQDEFRTGQDQFAAECQHSLHQ